MNKDAVKIMPNLIGKNGWYYADFVDPSGRRIRKALKTKDEKVAKQRLMKIQTEAYEKGYFEMKRPKKVFFKELAEKVINYASERKKSIKFYITSFGHLVSEFGEKLLHEITKEAIEKYQEKRKRIVSEATVNRELTVMKRAFNLAIQWGLIQKNPVRGVEFFKEPRGRIRFLYVEEINKLLDCCHGYIREIVLTALHAGMRKGEILGLRWGNVDLRNRLLILENTKNSEMREIPMSEAVYQMLLTKYKSKVRDDDEYVFANQNGEAFQDIRKSFNHALKIADIKNFRFHDLRHTYASQLVMAGVDILTVKELMGHKEVQTTLIYAHLAPKHKREAVAKFESHLTQDLSHKSDTNPILKNVEKQGSMNYIVNANKNEKGM